MGWHSLHISSHSFVQRMELPKAQHTLVTEFVNELSSFYCTYSDGYHWPSYIPSQLLGWALRPWKACYIVWLRPFMVSNVLARTIRLSRDKLASKVWKRENFLRRARTWQRWRRITRRLELRQLRVKARRKAMVTSSERY